MALTRYRLAALAAGLAMMALLLYLRDPPWLATLTSGLGRWQVEADGTRFRWTAARASFFIPADVDELILPIRSPKDTPADWPITATISVDDRPATRFRFEDESWHDIRLRILPATGRRRVRRVDIKLDRVRSHQRGVHLGEPKLLRRAR